jgi:hypothetical protein
MGQKEATEKAGESFFRKIVGHMWQGLAIQMPHQIEAAMGAVKDATPVAEAAVWKSWCNKLVTNKIIDQDTADLISGIAEEPFPTNFLGILMTRMKIFTHEIESIMSIYDLDRQYSHLAQTTPNPAPIDNLIRSMIIDPKRTNENRAQLAKHGYDSTQIDNLILSYYRTVDEGTIRACYLRGIITVDIMYERMHELGYTDTRIKEIVETWEVIPGPMDLFTMVAKEAFEPDIYTALGLDKEFPTEQVEWLKKQGISEAWAHKYWIAHWDQPSIGQGFEMLHRAVITPDELNLLFRAVEIPDFWRDKLTQIAYMPFTRVDVRRMHDMGTLSDDELIRSYMDLGFDAEKALKMAQFTVSFNASHEKELTRSAILTSYESALISRDAAKRLLVSQDYSEALAEYYLTLTDYNVDQETQKLLFENIRERYLLHDLSTTQVRDMLAGMNMQGDKIEALIANWNLRMYKYERLPTVTDLEDFLFRDLITEDQYRAIMFRHGYNAAHIQWYLNRINQIEPEIPKMPTKAELKRFLLKGAITEDQYRSRMETLGYSNYYIDLYLFDMEEIPEIPVDTEVTKLPTKGELGRFFIKDLITEDQYRLSMKDLGYTDDNITRFEVDLGKIPPVATLGRFFIQGLMTELQYVTYMRILGYLDVDISRHLLELKAKITES